MALIQRQCRTLKSIPSMFYTLVTPSVFPCRLTGKTLVTISLLDPVEFPIHHNTLLQAGSRPACSLHPLHYRNTAMQSHGCLERSGTDQERTVHLHYLEDVRGGRVIYSDVIAKVPLCAFSSVSSSHKSSPSQPSLPLPTIAGSGSNLSTLDDSRSEFVSQRALSPWQRIHTPYPPP